VALLAAGAAALAEALGAAAGLEELALPWCYVGAAGTAALSAAVGRRALARSARA
jgi:hypothetical protein